MCGGSTSVNYPGPTPQEQELQTMQLQQLQQQSSDMAAFKPFVLQQFGLQTNPNYDSDKAELYRNNITKFNNDIKYIKDNPSQFGDQADSAIAAKQAGIKTAEDYLNNNQQYSYTPEQQARNAQLQQIQDQSLALQKAQGERQAKAIAGTLPLSSALTNQMGLDFKKLQTDQGNNGNEIIGDNLDNAVAKTTSGQQALEALRTTYGTLASNEQNAAISQAALPGVYGSQYAGATSPGAPNAAAFSVNPGYFTAAYQPYESQAAGQFQANATNAANNQSFYNTMLTGLLNGAGRVAGSYMGGAGQ